MEDLILAIDQGTSSTKALLMNAQATVVSEGISDLETTYFPNGLVEQDPYAILASVEKAVRACVEGIEIEKIKSIGISNQRETFVLWNAKGEPVFPAVVWACKRSTQICDDLKEQNEWIQEKTGLIIDPYFSGTKLLWILENHPQIKTELEQGNLFFGTVDTWLLFKLTNGKSYFTDLTNASRTLFLNLKTLTWDKDILTTWGLKNLNLPTLKRSSDDFGSTDLFGLSKNPIQIGAMIGDSHASMFGETCFEEGDTKMTLGTGCSLLMSVGESPKKSSNGLLSTIGWSTQNQVVFAWEGAIVACGSMIEWLKNSMKVIEDVKQTAAIADSVKDEQGIFLVPSFSGMGAPFWQMDRKASFVGMTFGTSPAHLVKATLESIAFQIKAVIDAMESDLGKPILQIAMHGGLSKNSFVQKSLNELIAATIQIQDNPNISAQGAAFLAGLQAGIYSDLFELKQKIKIQTLQKQSKNTALLQQFEEWKNIIHTNTF